jgi:ubiquinone/menaquinone biosynthesis C-methylase UbiE
MAVEREMSFIPDEIEAHYREGRESERLSNEWGQLESLRTHSILVRHLPAPPATVLDVGGAAGAYAFPLANRGYQVHLIDPVELHLEQARSREVSLGVRLASITQGDARDLAFAPDSADAVLLLGPLYHLVERCDRIQALREAKRVLKPGGMLFAAAISRFASLIDGLSRGFFADPEFRKIIKQDLASGLHFNPTDRPEYFTTSHFHQPDELAAEVAEAGFSTIRVVAIEGPVWGAAGFREAWNDPEQRARLLDLLSAIEAEPSIFGASAHLMAVAIRPCREIASVNVGLTGA